MRDLPALWASTPWRTELESWLRPALDTAGLTPTGPLVQDRVRFWSTVLHVETTGGRVWVKENAPSQAFEAALVAEVERVAPGRMPPVVAVERSRGWLATRDLGTPLGERDELTDDAWVELAGRWAGLQRDLERHGPGLLATGLSTVPETGVPAWVDALADRLHALPESDPRRLCAQERRRVADGLPLLEEAAAALAASGLPPSLQHNDLHLGNALHAPGRPMAFIDLGDAVWAHPLTTLRMPVWALRDRPDDTELLRRRVLDAATEPWTDRLDPGTLRGLLPAADRVSAVHRALSWQRLVDDVPVHAVPDPYLRAVVQWLLVATAGDPYACWVAS